MNKSKVLKWLMTSGILAMSVNFAQAETLQDAVKHLLKANPEIRAQSYNRMARDLEVRQAKAGYLPTIDLYAGTGYDRHYRPTYDTTYPDFATISVRQNVFRFFGTQSEVERQEARVKSSAYLLNGSAENIALQATKVYLNVLKSQQLYDLAQENLINHRKIFDQVSLRSESGVDRRADSDQVTGRNALAKANLAAAQANLLDASTDYQAIIGYLPGDLVMPESVAASIPGTMEEAEQLALKNNPVVKSSKADLEARYKQKDTAKSQLYPSLDIALDYKWKYDMDYAVPGKDEENFTAMALISFNLFNGGWNKARIGQTTYEIHEAEEISRNTAKQTVQSVRLSWESNKSAAERVAYLEEYVKAAGQTADAFTAQWNIGRRTMFDLLDTQAEYINAKVKLLEARYDKMYAEYRILSGMGKLIPALGLPLPEQGLVAAAD
jgi:adhesin transport system outer membrane protein